MFYGYNKENEHLFLSVEYTGNAHNLGNSKLKLFKFKPLHVAIAKVNQTILLGKAYMIICITI